MQFRRLSIIDLPPQLIVEIMSFLEIHELFALEYVPGFQTQFQENGSIINYAVQKICNNRQKSQITQIIKKYKNQPAVHLPFWGYKTNGGVLNNNIPYWIGKAFLKSKQPTIGLMKNTTSTLSGVICQQYHEFVKIVMGLSRLLTEYIGGQHFAQTMDNTSIRLVIMLAFHIDLQDADESIKVDFMKHKQLLYSYATEISKFLIQNQDFQMQNTKMSKLSQLANIHEIELCRQLNKDHSVQLILRNRVQTLVIGFNKSYSLKQIKTFKNKVFKTNLTQKEQKDWILDKFEIAEEAKYIIFKKNQEGLLLWFDFGKENYHKLNIPFEVRPWANEIHVCIVRGENEQSHSGLTMSYISCKGIVI